MHGYDVHERLCEINYPLAGFQALGLGKYSLMVDMNLCFKNLPFSPIHR